MLSTSYDTSADALYVTLRQGAQVARTQELDPWTLVDEDARGAAVGIEIIHPAREWPIDDFLARYRIEGPNREMLLLMFSTPDDKEGWLPYGAIGDTDAAGLVEAAN